MASSTGTWEMERHPHGDLKLDAWIKTTEVSAQMAWDVRARAEVESRRPQAVEARRREREWARDERATSREFGPRWRFPTPGGITKNDMG